MDVILPVAGLGSRLRPQTWSQPKPLLGLAGKPILEHVLDEVMPLQPEKLVFITGYLGDQVEAWARATYDMPLAFVEQPEMRGQTDAILRVSEHATERRPDPVPRHGLRGRVSSGSPPPMPTS